MGSNTWIWIVIGIIVLIVVIALVVALVRGSKGRRVERDRADAAQLRGEGAEQDRSVRTAESDMQARAAVADRRAAEAQRKEVEAERLREEAEADADDVARQQQERDDTLRAAEAKDPDRPG